MGIYQKDSSETAFAAEEFHLYGMSREGILYDPFGTEDYVYELKDHQGNVRAAVSNPNTIEYLATMEDSSVSRESSREPALITQFLTFSIIPTNL